VNTVQTPKYPMLISQVESYCFDKCMEGFSFSRKSRDGPSETCVSIPTGQLRSTHQLSLLLSIISKIYT